MSTAIKTISKATKASRVRGGRRMPVPDIIQRANPEQRQTWMDSRAGSSEAIAGIANEIVPAMYQAWGAYGYQPAVTWYQLANMYVSWEYTATEKIARTIASLPAKLFRYENAAGKSLRPYYVKSLIHNDLAKTYNQDMIGRKLKRDHGIQRVEIDEHPFLDLINKPNGDMVRFNFWRLLSIHLELNGAVGIYKAKPDGFGNPTELHILPTTWTGQLKPVPSTDGVNLIKGYRLLDQNLNTEFERDEIIWIHYTSLRNPFEGMSSLKAQLYAFNMDQYLMQQITAFYKNGAMFSNVFSTENSLTQKQYNEIAAQLQNYQGAKNAGQKFILHSGLKMEKALTTTARDAMINEIERMARDKLLSGHDLSAGKIGLTEQQNRSNLEVVDMGFFNEAIKPRAMLITEYFDQFLVRNYDENLDFEFDYPHFQDRAQDIIERQSNIANGITTRNEERDKMGLEPVDGGDVILVSPMNVPLSSLTNPPEPAPMPAPKETPVLPEEKPPEGEPVPGAKAAAQTISLFVYQALRDEKTVHQVLGHQKPESPYILKGWAKKMVGDYPTIVPAVNGEVNGDLINCTAEEIKKLDTWEDRYERKEVTRGIHAFVLKPAVTKGSKGFWNAENKLLAWKKFEKEQQAYEPLFKRVMVKFFKDMSAEAIDRLEKHGVKIKSNTAAMSNNAKQKWLADNKARLDEFLPSKAEMKKRLKADMRPVYATVLSKAGQNRMEEFSKELNRTKAMKKNDGEAEAEIEFNFNMNDPKVKQWLGERLEEFSESTAQTTIDATKKILRADFEEGVGLSKMSEHLREYYTGAETYRANLIARTETTSAMNKGDLEGVRQMGLEDNVGKVWLAEPDDATRETHREAGERYSDGYDGETKEVMGLDDKFQVGNDKMEFPAGGSLAEECCNCRCTLVYEILGGIAEVE